MSANRAENSTQISISLSIDELNEIDRLARESNVTRSQYIRNSAVRPYKKGVLEIEFNTDNQSDVFIFLHSLVKQDQDIKLKTHDDGQLQKIEVTGFSIDFLNVVLGKLHGDTKIKAIRLNY